MKKIIVTLALVLALLFVLYFYFYNKNENKTQSELYVAIPANFPLAFESDNWEKYYNKIDTLTATKNIIEKDWYIGSKLNYTLTQQIVENLTDKKNKHILIALGNNGSEGIGILTVTDIKLSPGKMEEALTKLSLKWSSYNNQNNKIYTLTDYENKYTFYLAVKNGLLLFSFKSNFVEEALLAIEKQINVFDKKDLKEDFIVYLKPKQLNFLANYTLQPQYFVLSNSFEKLLGNTAFNIDLFNEELIFYGNTLYTKEMLLDTLKTLKVGANTNLEVLPDNISYYQSVCFNDTVLHTTDYLKNSFYDQLNQSYTTFIQNTYDSNIEANKGIVLSINSKEEMLNTLTEIDKNIIISEDDKNIYTGKIGHFVSENLMLPKTLNDTVYFALISNSIVISENISVVKNFIQKNGDNQLLKLNETFRAFKNNTLTQSNIDVYVNLSELRTYANTALLDKDAFANISKFNLQLSNVGSVANVQGKISFSSAQQSVSTKELWTVVLDGNAVSRPFETLDFNSQTKEILLQDDSNLLYQISKSGDVQFKIPIKGKIQSKIYQIDYYNNNKLQYLFNTESKIYVVDRNGDLVDGFPIELPAQASNGMLMTEYKDNKNIRYFVACNNGNIYGYEHNGKPLSGWSPIANVGKIKSSVERVVVGGKDYIYFTNTEGTFNALTRSGDKRFKSVKSGAKNGFEYENEQFIAGSNGKVYFIDMKGAITEKVILDESYQYFKFVKSINENKEAYAFANKHTFKFQLSQWKNLCSYKVDDEIRKIDAFVYQNKLWFLIYTQNEVYMIDEIGNLHPAFPLETKNDIGIYNLIAGKEKVIVYTAANKLIVKEIKWTNL